MAVRDITGLRSGKLVALEPTEKRYNGCVVWRCQCDCGRETEASMDVLVRGQKKSCGCLWNKPKVDLSGWQVGCLRVLGPIELKSGRIVWHCRCDCGNEIQTAHRALLKGKVTSCGCTAEPKPAAEMLD